MRGKRIFERFGFNVNKLEVTSYNEPKAIKDFEEWEFNPHKSDWENVENEYVLCNYKPTSELKSMLSDSINLTLF